MIIRKMEASDWPSVSTIYEKGILMRNATFETAVPAWEKWHADHLPFGRFIAEVQGEVAGWIALSPYSSRAVYRGVAGDSIYVDPFYKGKGVGSLLMEALLDCCKEHGMWTIQAGIFPENTASMALHKKFGFEEVGRRKAIGQLDGRWRDVILLERKL